MTDELKAEREAFEKYRSEHAPGLSESAYPIWQAAWQARAQLARATHTTGGDGDGRD